MQQPGRAAADVHAQAWAKTIDGQGRRSAQVLEAKPRSEPGRGRSGADAEAMQQPGRAAADAEAQAGAINN